MPKLPKDDVSSEHKAKDTVANNDVSMTLSSVALQSLIPMACRHSSESWEAVGALARHVVLKTPDKADFRAVAAEASVALVSNLPVISQHQFVLFAARLSRTPKVCLQTC